MHSAGQKMKDMASTAKEGIDSYKAKVQEKTDKATARSPEEKEIAHQNRKVKESQAEMELHEAKARHAAEKLSGKQSHGHVHQPVVGSHAQQPAIDPVTGATISGYPLEGHSTGHKYM